MSGFCADCGVVLSRFEELRAEREDRKPSDIMCFVCDPETDREEEQPAQPAKEAQ